jgi:hypothetical protein
LCSLPGIGGRRFVCAGCGLRAAATVGGVQVAHARAVSGRLQAVTR